MHYILLTLNFLLMITIPVVLGWLIARKRSVGWRLFLIGCATFIISQIGHLPFNAFMIPRLREWVEALPEGAVIIIMAIFLGLSAAVFEEGARYLGYKYWAKDARSWGSGMMLGAGHGGAESIILGVLVAINTVLLFAWKNDRLTVLIPADQGPLLAQTLETLFTAPWYATILGALERFFAIALHLSFSLLVLLAFIKRQPLWLLVAIAWHAIADAVAVYSAAIWGPYAAEILIFLMAVVSLSIVIRLRKPEPELPALVPLPEPKPPAPMQLEATADKLNDSRYYS